MESILILIIFFIVGANVGSFLNNLIYRLPRGLKPYDPTYSQCPHCSHRLKLLDLIPILGYLMLGGKCRYCYKQISPRYPLVEVICALLWTVVGWNYIQSPHVVTALFSGIFISLLLAIFFLDIEWRIIPDSLNQLLLLIGLLLAFWHGIKYGAGFGELWQSVLGAWIGCGTLLIVALLGRAAFRKDAMGHGDLKLARGIGAMLLPIGIIISIIFGVWVGLLVVLCIMLFRKRGQNVSVKASNHEVPESYVSILKCGFGYMLGLDLLANIYPQINENYFGIRKVITKQKNPPEHDPGQIPFGAFLAVSACLIYLFPQFFRSIIRSYFEWAGF